MKLYGFPPSPNTWKAQASASHLKMPLELEFVDLSKGAQREPSYLALNPTGRTPTLVDGDFKLWESNAIVRYLAAKHRAGVLEPADPHARAHAGAWMDWQLSIAAPAITDAFMGLIRTPPEKRNYAAIEESKKRTTAAMTILDGQLGKTAYVAGDAFSYGDIPVAVMAYRYRALVPERPPLPHFERWYAAIAARRAFKDQVAAVPLS